MSEKIPPFVVVIPARYASTRLPGKPLSTIGGVSMIRRVAQRATLAGAAQVVVAIDDERVAQELRGCEGDIVVCMTRADHASGSDRIAEAVARFGWPADTIVVNLQGDEPFAPAAGIRAVVSTLADSDAPMATLATPITSAEELFDPNAVKVVVSESGKALYFSRAPVPWPRDAFAADRETLPEGVGFLRHIGIYAYRAGFLSRFAALSRTHLEQVEALEQLRAMEHGYAIAVRESPEPFPAGIDTPADLARAEAWLAGHPDA
ncbi:3-deoxy-manno-octulosonate cytidylyltransferase (CMP-KDO synthetase) [Luteibacter sp. Sphag1AF]|uniref:3-deoxy-manno-octulosonate cytidylyltransferase n=1 Tax=Luteibacter sp. Sphag1AF TaxID=2587031 RepID=UPI0016076FA9|nr:3-deoxy-manno-octulosonate cytidylyltransferase [Luteibacter sp. Sphag1AF]MBB3227055.1 3-deoxy-manno-octulosonate cytidylyltransferase (CMP-KDO synthetase) [Luteibacter sp. Sphag1AF]